MHVSFKLLALRSRYKYRTRNWDRYNLRLLRHYFTATFAIGRDNKPGNLEVLRRILRHKSLAFTQVYSSRLIFYAGIKEEHDRFQRVPQINGPNGGVHTEKLHARVSLHLPNLGHSPLASCLLEAILAHSPNS